MHTLLSSRAVIVALSAVAVGCHSNGGEPVASQREPLPAPSDTASDETVTVDVSAIDESAISQMDLEEARRVHSTLVEQRIHARVHGDQESVDSLSPKIEMLENRMGRLLLQELVDKGELDP